MTQCSGDQELNVSKFVADFIVFVNLHKKVGSTHQHMGELSFEHLIFFVVPRDEANQLYAAALKREHSRPLINGGGQRKMGNLAVNVESSEMAKYKDAWQLIREANQLEN